MELRHLGHDVQTIQETGYANQEVGDDEVLAAAAADNRAVLTINRRHFIRLHRASFAHKGIVVCTLDTDIAGQAQRIDEALASIESLDGQLVRVNRSS